MTVFLSWCLLACGSCLLKAGYLPGRAIFSCSPMLKAAKPPTVNRRVLGSLPPHTIVSAGFAKLSCGGAAAGRRQNTHQMQEHMFSVLSVVTMLG
jgi:hypothetical protein